MIRFFTKDQYKNLVLAVWAIIAILQASYTQLLDDEAYYWVYSRHLEWGYFDHPPMIALLIKAGYAIFHNELGVRIGMIVMNVGTLVLVDKLIPQKNNRVFYLLLAGMGALQLGGMLAVPDIPLIFFATLYFYIFRKFLETQNWKNTVLLGISMALMFYSKYHGILIVFFTLVSNLSLLRIYRYYIAVIITTVLFFPHLYWQFTHDFPSLQYHLVERNASEYKLNFTTDYILGQLLLFGPLAGWLILYYAFRVHVQSNNFERSLKYSLIGVLVFFLISTVKGRVEANWTVMVFAPAFILAHQGIVRQGFSDKILRYTLVPSLLLVLVMRVYMVWDFMPGVHIRPEIHHNKEWTAAVAAKANGRPVVFLDSYQYPSKYMFYTGHLAYSLNSVYTRRSQYNYWHMEENMWGKDVLVVAPYSSLGYHDSLKVQDRLLYCDVQPNYHSYSLLQFGIREKAFTAAPGETLSLRFGINSRYTIPVPADDETVGYAIWQGEEWRFTAPGTLKLADALKMDSVVMQVKVPEAKGMYMMKVAVSTIPGVGPTHNSQAIKIMVK